PWSLEEACAPVSEPITPILITAPFGAAAADVPLAAAPDDAALLLLLLLLLHAATPSAAAKTPASSAVRVNADRLVSFAAADVRSRAVRCVLLITGFVPPLAAAGADRLTVAAPGRPAVAEVHGCLEDDKRLCKRSP